MSSQDPPRAIDLVRKMLADLVGDPDTPFLVRRAQSEAFAAAFKPPQGFAIEPDRVGGIAVEWITPDDAQAQRIFLHLHGGGYVLGAPSSSRPLTTAIAARVRCRVISVDYRIAPEHPFPAAVEDGLAVYRALIDAGHRPDHLAIGGESAGGGLALAVLLAAREAHLPMPAAALLISPWTDLRCGAPSLTTKAPVDPLLTRSVLESMARAYLGSASANNPLASPLLGDLSGLPPMLIHVGSEEVLLDDAQDLANRAKKAGVAVELEVCPDMIHVWHMFHDVLPEGSQAIDRLAEFLNAQWNKAEK